MKDKLKRIAEDIGKVNGTIQVMLVRQKFNPREARDMVGCLEESLKQLKEIVDDQAHND
tara:strand:- start:2980 stop:3156 length:177 start_codon:yes stop_codon:yes gene_type:complete